MIHSVPKYEEMRRQIRQDLKSGVWGPGEKIPSESELMQRFDASRSTVLRALRDLKRDGVLVGRQGAGNFVVGQSKPKAAPLTRLGALSQQTPGQDPPSILTEVQLQLSILAQQLGSELLLERLDSHQPLEAANELAERGIRGVFLTPLEVEKNKHNANAELIDVFQKRGIAVVLLDRDVVPYPNRSDFDLIGGNHRLMGYIATKHLLKLGRRRIAFIGVDSISPAVIERRSGHREALSEAGINLDPELDVQVHDPITDDVAIDIIKRVKPDAILCKSDRFAVRFMSGLMQCGIKCPDDIQLMGLGDEPFAEFLPLPLSTVRVPVADWADTAWRAMQDRLKQPELVGRLMQVNVHVVERSTTTPIGG